MPCLRCQHLVDRPDVPHVIRTCVSCGRVMHIHEPGKHGRGFNIQKGDQVVIPGGWLNLSFNPLKSTGTFSRSGLQWFAEMIMLEDIPRAYALHLFYFRQVDLEDFQHIAVIPSST
jgi:hypothetical protein